jgi:hypothetical protein
MTKQSKALAAQSPAEARATPAIGRAGRRLALGVALSAATWLATGDAQARPHGHPVGGIHVDVAPLLASGLAGYAEVVRADLAQALQAQFGGHLAPGQRLVVVVRGISLGSYVGGDTADDDYLDGVVTLVGPNGRELATQKILTVVSPASSGSAWYIAGGELRRTAALSQSFAAWARRYIPG